MKVGVIGGGIQGIALALEFAARGIPVELFEARVGLMQGASRQSEGKIHLGFVYANDTSLETPRLMSRGAFAFAPSLRRWLERDVADLAIPRPFTYLVHRNSLLDPATLAGRYAAIAATVREASRRAGGDYFGQTDASRIRMLSDRETAERFDPSIVAAAFESSEVAIDPIVVADLLLARVLGDPAIHVRSSTRVVAAKPTPLGVDLTLEEGAAPSQRYTESYVQVFNCAWCERLLIDATLGLRPDRPWSFRRKHFLRVPAGILRRPLGSATIVLGPFGDIVEYPLGGAVPLMVSRRLRGDRNGIGAAADRRNARPRQAVVHYREHHRRAWPHRPGTARSRGIGNRGAIRTQKRRDLRAGGNRHR